MLAAMAAARVMVVFLVLPLVACGGDDGAGVGIDGAIATIDAAADPTVVVATPASTGPWTVLFLGGDGVVLATVVADAAGLASAPMPAGGTITLIRPDAAFAISVVGVEPGERYAWGAPIIGGPVNSGAVVTDAVDLVVTAPMLAGAAGYDVLSSCRNTGPADAAGPITVAACDGRTDLLVRARRSDGVVLGTIAVPAVAPTPMLAVSPMPPYLPATPVLVRVQTTATQDPSVDRFVPAASGYFRTGGRIAVQSAVETSFQLEDVQAPLVVTRTVVLSPAGARLGRFDIGPGGAASVDATGFDLPEPSFMLGYDPTLRVATWPAAGAGRADVAVAQLGTGAGAGAHLVIGPYQDGVLAVPALPAPYQALNPDATSTGAVAFVRSTGGLPTSRHVFDSLLGQPGQVFIAGNLRPNL